MEKLDGMREGQVRIGRTERSQRRHARSRRHCESQFPVRLPGGIQASARYRKVSWMKTPQRCQRVSHSAEREVQTGKNVGNATEAQRRRERAAVPPPPCFL